MPGLIVRAMDDAEFETWYERTLREYAAEHVAAGNWAEAEALERARAENAERLPEGLRTGDMLFLLGERPDGAVVGTLWIGLRHPRDVPDCAWLYDIEVLEEHRGQGHGRDLLRAAERAVRERGLGALMLNVFGGNDAATALYASEGYTVVTTQMRKQLEPVPGAEAS